jgi:hypothetical protein
MTRTLPRTTLPLPTSLYQWREGLRCRKCDHSPNSAACECRWSHTWPQKAHCNASAASALDTHSITADMRPSASHVGAPTSMVGALPCRNSLSAVVAGETTRRTNRTVLSGKKRRWLLQTPKRAQKSAATGHPAAPKAQRARPFAKQMDLGEGWDHVVRGRRVVKATTPPPQSQIPLLSRLRRCPSSLM